MLFIVALIHSLCIQDFNAPKEKSLQSTKAVIGGADELIKYKELLDNNVITQEEFETKKRQILNL